MSFGRIMILEIEGKALEWDLSMSEPPDNTPLTRSLDASKPAQTHSFTHVTDLTSAT